MLDLLKQLVTATLPVVPYLVVLLVLFVLFALVYFYRKFSGSRAEAERARQGVELELSLLRRFGRLFTRKTDVVLDATDPNALTISRPIPAVPPPTSEPKP